MEIKTFESLECWKIGVDIRKNLSKIVATFPSEEKYRLGDQIKRASRSVTNNIAEGYGRYHYKENIQFCRTSRGSAYELLDHLIIALEENYISEEVFKNNRKLIQNLLALLNGYINFLKKQIES